MFYQINYTPIKFKFISGIIYLRKIIQIFVLQHFPCFREDRIRTNISNFEDCYANHYTTPPLIFKFKKISIEKLLHYCNYIYNLK